VTGGFGHRPAADFLMPQNHRGISIVKNLNSFLNVRNFVVIGIVAGVILGGVSNLTNNHNGRVTESVCAYNPGGHVDPRTGDAPDCDDYKVITRSQSPIRTFAIGGFEGGIIGLFAGFGAAALAESVLEKANKKQ
jgi:hypothetical protein